MRVPAPALPAFVLGLVLAAGCGDGDVPAAPDQGNRGVPPGLAKPLADQATPQATAAAFYRALAASEFAQACALITPGTYSPSMHGGRPCPTELADDFDPEDRAKMARLAVDTSLIKTAGDTAKIPDYAIYHAAGPKPSPVPTPGYDGSVQTEYPSTDYLDLDLVRYAGAWYINDMDWDG